MVIYLLKETKLWKELTFQSSLLLISALNLGPANYTWKSKLLCFYSIAYRLAVKSMFWSNAGDSGLIPGPGRSPGEGMATHSSILISVHAHGQRSLEGYSTWVHKELDMTEQSASEITQIKHWAIAYHKALKLCSHLIHIQEKQRCVCAS